MMKNPISMPVDVTIVAVPETAGSVLYSMLDVLLSDGNIWQTLVRTSSADTLFKVRIISPTGEPFTCGYGFLCARSYGLVRMKICGVVTPSQCQRVFKPILTASTL
jgi:hypothetical protein